jgi:hypothetical protein
MNNEDFSEQRGQSQACLSYAESRGDWAKPMNNEDFSLINYS